MKFTSLGSMPTACASCIGRRWSGPPGAEPPPTARDLGSAFQASTNSVMVLYGESLATTMAPDSSMSLAIGVVWSSLAVDWLVYWAPTTPRPIIINSLPLPFSDTVLASPVVPEAPARLNTSMFCVAPMSSMTLAAARAVVSYPLPGVFGTMNRRPVSGSSAGAEAPGSARSAVAPQPVVSITAAATRAAPSLSRPHIIIPSSRGLGGRGWWADKPSPVVETIVPSRTGVAYLWPWTLRSQWSHWIAAATSLNATAAESVWKELFHDRM